jgi:hypothetical protein
LIEFASSRIVEKKPLLGKDYLIMKVNCGQYSKSMELLSLKRNLEAGISDEEERERTQERIQVLEKELELD